MKLPFRLKTAEEHAAERELTGRLAGRLQAAAFGLAAPTHISQVMTTMADGAAFFIQQDGKMVAVTVTVQDEYGPIMGY